MEITPEQKNQLKTWAEQRDEILGEISVNKKENERLLDSNKNLTASNSDLTERNLKLEGSIAALDAQDKARAGLLSKEVSELEIKKTKLETTISGLETHAETLTTKKVALHSDIGVAIDLHQKVFSRASMLDQAIDRVVRINEQNITDVNIMVSTLKGAIGEMSTSLVALNDGVFERAEKLQALVDTALSSTSKNMGDVEVMVSDFKQHLVDLGVPLSK